MALENDLPVVDHHCHLAPTGQGVDGARRFRDAGGTHLFLTTMAYNGHVPMSVEEYGVQFATTEQLAQRIEKDVGVSVRCVIAPYPVDLLHQSEKLGLEGAAALHCAALDLAGHWVDEQRAVAIGEVGRAHFPVPAEVHEALVDVFRHGLEVARDADCPAVVHSEDLTPEGFRELADFAVRCAFPLGRLVKHFARAFIPSSDRYGIVPSFLARRDVVEASIDSAGPWFWETDFLDDAVRPGAVLDVVTIPRRARALLQRDPAFAERLRVPFQDSVEQVYGFRPEVRDARKP